MRAVSLLLGFPISAVLVLLSRSFVELATPGYSWGLGDYRPVRTGKGGDSGNSLTEKGCSLDQWCGWALGEGQQAAKAGLAGKIKY